MKKQTFRNIALAAALAVAVPAGAEAATAASAHPVHVNYETTFGPIFGVGAPWSGRLQLTINPDGIIQGYYRPEDDARFVPVTGGRNGNSVWLDIGTSGRLQVTGTVQNQSIVGAAVDTRTFEQYSFHADVAR